MKKSSIEYLVERFAKHYAIHQLQDEIEKAKAMHKQEIVDAHAVGRIKQCAGVLTDGYEYYKETFKS